MNLVISSTKAIKVLLFKQNNNIESRKGYYCISNN